MRRASAIDLASDKLGRFSSSSVVISDISVSFNAEGGISIVQFCFPESMSLLSRDVKGKEKLTFASLPCLTSEGESFTGALEPASFPLGSMLIEVIFCAMDLLEGIASPRDTVLDTLDDKMF